MIRRGSWFVVLVLLCIAAPRPSSGAATNPHGPLTVDCAVCHTEQSWRMTGGPQGFDHDGTGYSLEGLHRFVNCRECHKDLVFANAGTSCVDCHTDFHKGQLGPTCAQCHTPAGWVEHSEQRRRHDETALPLVGAHERVDCDACHSGQKAEDYARTPSECIACHADQYAATTNPPHQASGLGTDCIQCHGVFSATWGPGDFVHSALFPLTGGHGGLECTACHTSGFEPLSPECQACHLDDYNATTDPDHVASAFPLDCAQCHQISGWEPATIDHDQTAFPLTGEHVEVACASCHTAGYTGTSTECQACHLDDYNDTDDPNHSAGGFPLDCTQCHQTSGWEPATLDHDQTAFPLTGEHVSVACASCHTAGYTGTSTECQACHLDDYNATTDPDHAGSAFPLDCAQCHQTTGWDGATIDHNQTAFPLTGEHVTVACTSCHTAGYTGTSTECQACHLDDYNATTDPDHAGSAFPLDCAQCHQTTGWDGATIDHNQTAFPLTGEHVTVACTSCHTAGYTGTSTECQACHLADYNGTSDPDHAGSGFPLDCALCHQTSGWDGAQIDHNQTAFPLTGQHTVVDCASCHASGYTGTSTECQACHLADYNGTTDPDHAASGYPLDCAQCHQTTGWDGAQIDHNQTAFPLTGQHTTVACASCHGSGYTGTPTECQACHLADYNGVTDPNHVAGGYPLDCTQCHRTSGWEDVQVNHDLTAFPLTGEHVTAACASCHASGFTGTPTECQACHLDDYNSVADPNHVASGFPLDCAQCHQTTGWDGATIDHNQTAFPLTGEHVTVACASCHASGFTGTPTECQACHLDDYNGVTDPNHVTSGFPLDCALCHQTTGWDGATIDHNQTAFPLTGQHTTVACASCHAGGYTGTPTQCEACHLADYNGTADPDHAAAGFPLDCAGCHTTNGWSPSTFNHDPLFPILSGTHQGKWNSCTDCHVVASDFSTFECIFCHEHNQADTNNDHSGVGGYQYNSQACFFCHPRGNS